MKFFKKKINKPTEVRNSDSKVEETVYKSENEELFQLGKNDTNLIGNDQYELDFTQKPEDEIFEKSKISDQEEIDLNITELEPTPEGDNNSVSVFSFEENLLESGTSLSKNDNLVIDAYESLTHESINQNIIEEGDVNTAHSEKMDDDRESLLYDSEADASSSETNFEEDESNEQDIVITDSYHHNIIEINLDNNNEINKDNHLISREPENINHEISVNEDKNINKDKDNDILINIKNKESNSKSEFEINISNKIRSRIVRSTILLSIFAYELTFISLLLFFRKDSIIDTLKSNESVLALLSISFVLLIVNAYAYLKKPIVGQYYLGKEFGIINKTFYILFYAFYIRILKKHNFNTFIRRNPELLYWIDNSYGFTGWSTLRNPRDYNDRVKTDFKKYSIFKRNPYVILLTIPFFLVFLYINL